MKTLVLSLLGPNLANSIRYYKDYLQKTLRRYYGRIAKRVSDSAPMTWKWLYIDNRAARRAYVPAQLSAEATRVLQELCTQGIATSTVDVLFKDMSQYEELVAAIAGMEQERQAEIAAARLSADIVGGPKNYVYTFLGNMSAEEMSHSIYNRFAAQPILQNIADHFFGMRTELRSVDIWRNFVTRGKARRAQMWHNDPEDRHILKIFLYLTDVDEGGGPFSYARGTHQRGFFFKHPRFSDEQKDTGIRSTDEAMNEVVPRELWHIATGKKGTIVFADTSGYHKGGLVREHERLLFLAMYISPASSYQRRVNSTP